MESQKSPPTGAGSANVVGFHDSASGSVQYVVEDPATGKAALIDIVLDFDPANARTGTETAEEILAFVDAENLEIEWILDTHPHADHMMASAWLGERTGAPTAIGEKVAEIAALWREIYHHPGKLNPRKHFDRLLADGETFSIGSLPVRVMLTPGHTLGSITYVVGNDAAFVHDTFMHVDAGTARADFPGGSAHELYRSLQAILSLPDETRLFVGHDYGTDTRKETRWEATVARHRADNIHIGGGVSEDEFVALRETRDATLSLPDRMLFALQFNLRGGRLPPEEDDCQSYFRIPANKF